MVESYDALTDFLRTELGEQLLVVLSYDDEDYTVHHETEAAERRFEESVGLSEEELHRDLVLGAMEREMGEERYDTTTRAGVLVGEDQTVYHLPVSDTAGVLFVVAPDATVELPTFVEACRERLEA